MKPFSRLGEDVLKLRSDPLNQRDEATEFDHVGVHPQLNLPRNSQDLPVRNAQARNRLMEIRGRRFPGSGRPPAWKAYMPCWVRELHRRWGYFIPRVVWCLATALFIAVWIYVALQTEG